MERGHNYAGCLFLTKRCFVSLALKHEAVRSGLISSQRELLIVIHKVLMSTIIWTLLACVVCLPVETVRDESEQLCECVWLRAVPC